MTLCQGQVPVIKLLFALTVSSSVALGFHLATVVFMYDSTDIVQPGFVRSVQLVINDERCGDSHLELK